MFLFAKKLFCGRLFSIPRLVEEMKFANLGNDEIEQCANLGLVIGNLETFYNAVGECRKSLSLVNV